MAWDGTGMNCYKMEWDGTEKYVPWTETEYYISMQKSYLFETTVIGLI